MFEEELNGIEKSRKIKKQEKTSLDNLLDLFQILIEKYKPKSKSGELGVYNKIYKKTYAEIYQDLINLPFFNEQDIAALLNVTIPKGLEFTLGLTDQKILGIYTGTLVHLLTERNQEQGKRTIIHIKDITFDYLFCSLEKADTIILENCTGDYILSGAVDGRNGLIRNIYIKNIIGDRIFSNIINGGRICNLVVENPSSEVSYGHNNSFTIGNGAIDLFVKVGLLGDKIYKKLSSSELGEINYSIGLYIEKTALNKSKSKYRAFRISSHKMRLFTQYNHSLNTTLLKDIYTLAETLSTKNPREIMATLDEMTVLYENVRDLD